MRKLLIASHGRFAEGLAHSVTSFAGNRPELSFMCCYMDNTDPEEQIGTYFDTLDQDDEVLVFTDLLGGSVNQKFMKYLNRPHTHIIAGVTMSILLEAIFLPEEYLEPVQIETLADFGRSTIQYMNTYQVRESPGDEL